MQHVETQIAYVLFLDIVEYSLLPLERQEAVSAAFRGIVRRSLERGLPAGEAAPTVLDRGDGVALVFVGGPSWAIECAVAVTGELSREGIEVRAGLHLGPVTRVEDVNSMPSVSGPAISLAERVMSCADAGQLLLSGAAAEMAVVQANWAVALEELGEHSVKHGVKVRLVNLVTEACGRPGLPARLKLAFEHPDKRRLNNLTEPERPFIGREPERAELLRLLGDPKVRLVTVTGMGGIGKTRIAIDVSQEAETGFEDGVCFVACDALRGAGELLAAIAAAMELDRDGDSVVALAEAIGEVDLLLVLDCFERLVECREVVEDLVRHTRGLKILVSSRVGLGLPREYEFALGPMPTHAVGGHLADAAALFWDVAGHVSPRLAATKAHARTANQIVTALEGVPLAILLAATRLSHMTLEELLEQVQSRRLKTLKRAPVSTPDRHETLTRVISDSFDLLDDSEMQRMVDLSCFHGFYTEDAVAILGGQDEVREGIAQLRNNSLIAAQTLGSRMRFRILDTVREYIEDEYAERWRQEVRAGHAAHYTRKALDMREQAASGDWKRANAVLWLEMGNFRQAIRWAAENCDAELLESQARSLARPLAEAGLRAEFDVLRQAVEGLAAQTGLDALAELAGLEGMLHRRAGETDAAFAAWTKCAELWRQFGDADRQADVLVDFCDAALSDGNLDAAMNALEQYDKLCSGSLRSDNILACGQILHARFSLAEGDPGQASAFAADGLTIADRMPPDHNSIFVLGGLGGIYIALGDTEVPEGLFMRALRIAGEGNYPDSARRLLLDLADVYHRRSSLEQEAVCLAVAAKLPAPAKEQVRADMRKRTEEVRSRLGAGEYARLQQDHATETWSEAARNLGAGSP